MVNFSMGSKPNSDPLGPETLPKQSRSILFRLLTQSVELIDQQNK